MIIVTQSVAAACGAAQPVAGRVRRRNV